MRSNFKAQRLNVKQSQKYKAQVLILDLELYLILACLPAGRDFDI